MFSVKLYTSHLSKVKNINKTFLAKSQGLKATTLVLKSWALLSHIQLKKTYKNRDCRTLTERVMAAKENKHLSFIFQILLIEILRNNVFVRLFNNCQSLYMMCDGCPYMANMAVLDMGKPIVRNIAKLLTKSYWGVLSCVLVPLLLSCHCDLLAHLI